MYPGTRKDGADRARIVERNLDGLLASIAVEAKNVRELYANGLLVLQALGDVFECGLKESDCLPIVLIHG
jgi:hypothetical protein